MQNSGIVVGVVQERPVWWDVDKTDLVPGETRSCLTLKLKNVRGEERIFTVPIEQDVVDFYFVTP